MRALQSMAAKQQEATNGSCARTGSSLRSTSLSSESLQGVSSQSSTPLHPYRSLAAICDSSGAVQLMVQGKRAALVN
jgi:hypothetical protein